MSESVLRGSEEGELAMTTDGPRQGPPHRVWSQEEADIILSTQGMSADDTNARLAAAGFPPASAVQLKQKRMNEQRKLRIGTSSGRNPKLDVAQAQFSYLLTHRGKLLAQQERGRRLLANLEAELSQVNEDIARVANENLEGK